MNLNILATTIVAGALSAIVMVCTTVLLVVGEPVPGEFPELLRAGFYIAIGSTLVNRQTS